MSIHKSLKQKAGTSGHKNVLTRAERIKRMQVKGTFCDGRGKDNGNPFNLPKTRVI